MHRTIDVIPANALLPTAQIATLRLRHGNTFVAIPITVSYTFVEPYQPWVTRDFQARCDRVDEQGIPPRVLIVASISLLGLALLGLVIRWWGQ